MKRYLILILVASSAWPGQCQKQEIAKTLPADVIEAIEKRITADYSPSMAIALIDSSGTYYFNFGKATKDGKLVDENTIYEIGSISKVFTGILLAQQVLDGDLDIDTKVNELLPRSVQVPVKGEQEITLGHLTDHTSGLPRMPNNFTPTNPANPYADYSVEQMYAFISSYTPTRAVGESYEYSNLGQGLLGYVLSVNKKQSFEQLMVQTIADPLSMPNTRIAFTEEMKANLALGHSGGEIVENWDIPTLAGAGAIRSSTKDMIRFIAANLGYIKTPLRAAMDLSHQRRHDKAGEMSVGMAWHIKKGADGDVIWHNGGTGGYRTFAGFVKETGKGVVVLTNSSQGSDDIGFNLLDSNSKLANPKLKSDAVKLSEATLSRYEGVYALSPLFMITVTREGDQLFGQATGQNKFRMYPESDTLFYLRVVEAEISFQLEEDQVKSLTLFQAGRAMPGRKVE
ncbi:MAG: serine hydrolase [Cytophagales bacterium]|nr:serine hydrolase [Cytophagales bacterium]